MAKGKQLGDFSLRFTSLTYAPGPAGSTLIYGNCEGTATGFGTVHGTGTFVGGKSGTMSWLAPSAHENRLTNRLRRPAAAARRRLIPRRRFLAVLGKL
jgi:hypothetical protein